MEWSSNKKQPNWNNSEKKAVIHDKSFVNQRRSKVISSRVGIHPNERIGSIDGGYTDDDSESIHTRVYKGDTIIFRSASIVKA